VYIDNMSYVYTGELWGEKIDGLYEQAIQGTDTVLRVWASNMTSELSNHHSYEYLGGMSMAVAKLTGKQPAALIADVRDPSGARVRDFREVLDTNLRTELLNPAWIAGMKRHGYAGAGHMAEIVKNTFGWSVTRKGDVRDSTWREIYQVYVQEKNNPGLRQWFEQANPHALQKIAAAMLEADRKGYWKAEPGEVQALAELYADSVARHGLSSGLISGGNEKLQRMVTDRLLAAPGKEALAKAMTAAIARSVGAAQPADAAAKVYGAALQPEPKSRPATGASARQVLDYWPLGIGAGAGLLFLIGYLRRRGAAR
jgi:cobaltochelatase CobN